MPGLNEQIARLTRLRDGFVQLAAAAATSGDAAGLAFFPSPIVETTAFGSNPGNLKMFSRIAAGVGVKAPLVVALHGCGETAAAFDYGSGWSDLAERHGFALLMPEQQPGNNAHRCFTWFLTGDTRRNSGEAASIRAMVEHMIEVHDLDRDRVFVTGLSAGGGMTSALLAGYPDVFKAGAILAGVPAGAASTLTEALEAMRQGRSRTARQWGDLVRQAARHPGALPRVAIWHGTADKIVHPANAEAIAQQWVDVHGLRTEPDVEARDALTRRRTWLDAEGREMVQVVEVQGMAHGVAIKGGDGPGTIGKLAPFHYPIGVASTEEIVSFFGIARTKTSSSSTGPVPPRTAAPSVHTGVMRRILHRLGLAKS